MIKNIIREIPAENTDFSWYFDDDGLTEASGDFCNTLFIIGDKYIRGFNTETYSNIKQQAEDILSDFEIVDGKEYTYKQVMAEYGIKYNPTKCHKLKKWAETAFIYYTDELETMRDYLTIITGKQWQIAAARGYRQGDYVDMLYCEENYKNGVVNYGEIWLGAGKEFSVIYLDENGNECDTVYGYIIADCEIIKDSDYKKLICECACIDEAETELELIDSYNFHTDYSYKII